AKTASDYLAKLLDCRGLVDFFRSQPGLFRVHVDGIWPPNIGDVYGIPTIEGESATILTDFKRFWDVPRAPDLLNVRFFVLASSRAMEGQQIIYRDANWQVFENHMACPRAWLVHDVVTETSREAMIQRMKEPGFDPLRTAVLADRLDGFERTAEDAREEIKFD